MCLDCLSALCTSIVVQQVKADKSARYSDRCSITFSQQTLLQFCLLCEYSCQHTTVRMCSSKFPSNLLGLSLQNDLSVTCSVSAVMWNSRLWKVSFPFFVHCSNFAFNPEIWLTTGCNLCHLYYCKAVWVCKPCEYVRRRVIRILLELFLLSSHCLPSTDFIWLSAFQKHSWALPRQSCEQRLTPIGELQNLFLLLLTS